MSSEEYKQVNIRLRESILDKAKSIAESYNVSLSGFIAVAIEERIEKENKNPNRPDIVAAKLEALNELLDFQFNKLQNSDLTTSEEFKLSRRFRQAYINYRDLKEEKK